MVKEKKQKTGLTSFIIQEIRMKTMRLFFNIIWAKIKMW